MSRIVLAFCYCIRLSFETSEFSFEKVAELVSHICSLFLHAAQLPIITTHPQQLINAVLGETLIFSIQATGREPLSYQWQHKIEGGNGEWQSCDVGNFPGANSSTFTIPSVQNSNKGSYRCIVSNCAGSETSECAMLTIG